MILIITNVGLHYFLMRMVWHVDGLHIAWETAACAHSYRSHSYDGFTRLKFDPLEASCYLSWASNERVVLPHSDWHGILGSTKMWDSLTQQLEVGIHMSFL